MLHTFANTQSALMKKRVSQFMIGSVCPACHGKRLKKEALSVKFAGLDIGAFAQLPLARLAEMLEPIARGEWPEPDTAHSGKDAGKGSVLSRSAMRDAVDKRIAAGGSAHKASPDVRRTPNLSEEKRVAAQRFAAELLERLTTLVDDLGLGYLALERSTPTLSSGELQGFVAIRRSAMLKAVKTTNVIDEAEPESSCGARAQAPALPA